VFKKDIAHVLKNEDSDYISSEFFKFIVNNISLGRFQDVLSM
jgi:hypothetical protein